MDIDLKGLPEDCVPQWSFKYSKGGRLFAKTLPELLDRSAKYREKLDAEGKGYDLVLTFSKPRTVWPKVLIIDRDINPNVWFPEESGLHWTDSSGSRAVYFWNPKGDEYDREIDLPEDVFHHIHMRVNNLRKAGHEVQLCMRRDDPGLGIWIPEIDEPIVEAGGIPDGCIKTGK